MSTLCGTFVVGSVCGACVCVMVCFYRISPGLDSEWAGNLPDPLDSMLDGQSDSQGLSPGRYG